MGTERRQARWPAHLPAGALRVVRWSARYEETVAFYRDAIGLPVLETFHDSYGLDGTILGLPGGQVHLEIVRAGQASYPGDLQVNLAARRSGEHTSELQSRLHLVCRLLLEQKRN